jgi:hypothetical protein
MRGHDSFYAKISINYSKKGGGAVMDQQFLFLVLIFVFTLLITSSINSDVKPIITTSIQNDQPSKNFFTSTVFTCADNKLLLESSYSKMNPDKLPQIKYCAEQGHAESQYIYANTFYNSDHLNNEIQQAVVWWTKAGEQGYGDAWYRLGLLYQQGFDYSVENRADIVKAANYFQLGAKSGSSHAQYYLGTALYRGWGIRQDKQAAKQWWKIAAELGNKQAEDAYTNGTGILWYPVENSPVWMLFNRVNNKTRAQIFAMLTKMLPYENDTEFDLAHAKVEYPEPAYFDMYIDIYQVLKHLPEKLIDMPHCSEFKKILTDEFHDELESYFNSYKYDEPQINSALWYALQRVCAPD